MVRSRCITVLSMAVFMAILIPVVGWCGGPCGPTDRGGQERADQQMPPGPAAAEAVSASPYHGGGSMGNVGAAGSNGASPGITMSDLGLNSVWGWSGRFRYDANIMEFPIQFVADYSWANMKGSVESYSGPTGAGRPTFGAAVSSKFDFSLLSFMADVDASPALSGGGFGYPLEVGPRLSYTTYISQFSWEETAGVNSSSRSRSFGMPGIGIWACLNLASLTGYGSTETGAGIIEPKLRCAASIGQGGQMRYSMWDVSLEVLSVPETSRYDLTFPKVSFEVGYARYLFDETLDRISPGTLSPSNAEHSVDVIILRLDVDLPAPY